VRASTAAKPAQLDVKTFDGSSSGSEQLALKVADNSTARGLVHRYLVMVRQNGRQGSANTKTRAEVRGGGKKPFAQKGTGSARQGSRRTPLKPGGGVIFGPKPKDWSIKMNKKERRLALATALQSAAPHTIVVEDMQNALPAPKTKALVDALEKIGADREEHTLLIVNQLTDTVKLSARNVEKLELNTVDSLSVYDVLRADKILVEQSALKYINEFYGPKQTAATA
jgi:large subunit ribosomal protein L4